MTFLDTNVLVYAADDTDVAKHGRAYELVVRAIQEQAQRDRWNQMQAEENRRRQQSILTEWEQRQARERQIRQEEYIRQDARERYQRADQVDRAIMKGFGY